MLPAHLDLLRAAAIVVVVLGFDVHRSLFSDPPVDELETIDYEGMLPEEAGNRSGEPDDNIFRESVLSKVDKTIVEAPGVTPYLALPEVGRNPPRTAPAAPSAGTARTGSGSSTTSSTGAGR